LTKPKQERIIRDVKIYFICLILLCSALSAISSEEGFARYQSIIDRRPFGEEPPETETVQISINESFAKNLRLSMLFEGPSGDLRAGIVDTVKNKSYTLKVGESIDRIELVEADILKSEAMLKKGNEVVLFKLEAGKPEVLSKKQQSSRQSSYAKRRKALLKKVEARKAEQKPNPIQPQSPNLTGVALRQHLEQVQMNAIREGLPPLPMPLTPEMDAQLVSEGVLPPQ